MSRLSNILAFSGLTVALCAAPAAFAASEDAVPPDPRSKRVPSGGMLDALISRVKFEQSRLNSLEARFVERKESEMLIEPLEATGAFSYLAPDRARWEYDTPDPISLVILGDEMTTWYRDLKQAERMHVGRHSQQVMKFLGAGNSIETLLEYFHVVLKLPEDPQLPYRLDLEPHFSRISKRLQQMIVWIDAESFLPIRLRYIEPDGDVTEYEFAELKVNDELPQDRFELSIPAEVKIRSIDLGARAGSR